MSDILVDIPDEHLPKLASLFENKATWAPWMVGFIRTFIKWKQSSKYRKCITFMSPNNCWKEDGTIIATITCISQDIIVFTLDDNCTNLYRGLSETKRLNFKHTPRNVFYGVHEKHIPTVRKIVEEKKLNIVYDRPCYIYAIDPEEAEHFNAECPSDVYLKKIDIQAAKEINDLWPHKFPHSEDYIGAYLEMNGAYGTFLKHGNKMVAWIMKHGFEQLSMLHTVEEYRGKSYGSLMVKVMSRETAHEGHWPMATVLINNQNAINMFQKLGFKNSGSCTFLGIE